MSTKTRNTLVPYSTDHSLPYQDRWRIPDPPPKQSLLRSLRTAWVCWQHSPTSPERRPRYELNYTLSLNAYSWARNTNAPLNIPVNCLTEITTKSTYIMGFNVNRRQKKPWDSHEFRTVTNLPPKHSVHLPSCSTICIKNKKLIN